MYTPRPYQLDCLAALAKAREDGVKKGLVIMASGLGKTLTAAFDVRQFLETQPNARVLCLCHQEEILLQSKRKFQKVFGEEYSYGLYTGNYKTRHAVSFLFATFQTMRDHREEFPSDAFAYVLVDEAHHTSAETYQPTVDYFAPQFLLGLTATKDRMDGQDILDTYEQVLYEMDIYDGWNQDWLARVDYRIMLDDLNQEEFEKYVGPSASGEKVSLSQLNRTIFAPQRDEDIVKSIREQLSDLENPSIFVFCSSIDHAKNMSHHFGGEAAVIHSGQSSALNEAVLSEFRAGKLRVVISVNMLNEGIDVPETDAIVFLRSTESSTIFFQQLGRGLRTGATKRAVRVLDYVANLERISTILEMEETAKKRLPPIPTSSASPKPDPLIVNIPATKFRVERVELEQIIERRLHMFTAAEVIHSLQEYAKEHNTTKLCHIDVRPLYSLVTLNRLFGGYQQAVEAAGLEYYRIPNRWTKETIVQAFRDNIKDGKMPCSSKIKDDPCLPSLSTIWKHFSNWQELAEATGLTVDSEVSKEDMLGAYLEASIAVGKWLNGGEIDACSELSNRHVYRNRFGSLGCLPELATQLDPDRPELRMLRPMNGLYTRAIIEDRIHAFIRANHRLPTTSDFKTDSSLPPYQVCYKKCQVKTLADLLNVCRAQQTLDEVGEQRPPEQPLIAEDEIGTLRTLALRLGRRLRSRDLRPANGTKCHAWYANRGVNMDEVNKMANVDQILAELQRK